MIYFNYKRGTQVFDNVKSLADAINFELPRKWYCSDEMNRKADEINVFTQKKVSCAHLGVVGLFDSYTPHISTTMLEATWYCAVSAYDKAIRNLHCVVRMHTGYDYPYAVGVGTSLATDRNPGKMKSFLGALRDLGASVPESVVEYISDLAVAMVLVRQKALQDKGVFSAASSMPDMFIATTTMS